MSELHLPGLIDCHVHFREPGLTEKGDMQSESRAAIAGGVTTVCEMPNTVPPTVTVAALEQKVRIAERIQDCDIRFFMGATEPQHLLALRDVWRGTSPALRHLKHRCVGLKIYVDHSTGNQRAEHGVIAEAFKLCGELGIPLVAHCEDAEINAKAKAMWVGDISDPHGSYHSQMRPPESEIEAIASCIALAKQYSTRFHVAHLSTRGGLQLIREAKTKELSVTCEVAPHHLFLTADDYETLGTLGKMNPPLRSREDRDALWAGIADGTVDCVATDHAPHTLDEKNAWKSRTGMGALDAPSGVPGVETMLPLLLTVAAGKWPHPSSPEPRTRVFEYSSIRALCYENPNRVFNLHKTSDDAVIIDPHAEWIIHAENLHAKCGWTPYEGWRVMGRVKTVKGTGDLASSGE